MTYSVRTCIASLGAHSIMHMAMALSIAGTFGFTHGERYCHPLYIGFSTSVGSLCRCTGPVVQTVGDSGWSCLLGMNLWLQLMNISPFHLLSFEVLCEANSKTASGKIPAGNTTTKTRQPAHMPMRTRPSSEICIQNLCNPAPVLGVLEDAFACQLVLSQLLGR